MNRKKLREKMKSMGVTHKELAAKECWDCAVCTVSQKINGVRPLKLSEANKLASLLKLTSKEYYDIFFCEEAAA